MINIKREVLDSLLNQKNLLAFSGGVDSTALFFLLLENNINFDIAIVDYNIRIQSKEEVHYAKTISEKYNKKIYIKSANLENSNFEANARKTRYDFFEEIIKKENYQNLITAHQLNDKIEWFLMQMTKGAGLVELFGMDYITNKENYNIIRPLLDISKENLQNYLDRHNIKYFIDQSNFDSKYKRNHFRKEFANKLIKDYSSGISKTFEYLKNDINSLNKNKILLKKEELFIIENINDDNLNIKAIDKIIKQLGFIMTKSQRDEILKTKDLVLFHNISVVFCYNKIFISPYIQIKLDKKFKESCRVLKIPAKIRCYIYEKNLLEDIRKLL
jgi:tRNA(Ile)-lysidine synthase